MPSSWRRRFIASVICAIIVVLITALGLKWLHLYRASHKITDQQLLREAQAERQKSGFGGPSEEIFEQQATQGYYDDALANARLSPKTDDLYWYIIDLAKIRTENGDLPGAKAMIQMFPDQDFQKRMIRSIALVQAQEGDLSGALETGSPLPDKNEILMEFARFQIKKGDFGGALSTAERMTGNSADDVFYEIGDALRLRGEKSRVRQLALRMNNRRLANLFLQLVPLMLREPQAMIMQANNCEMASFYASKGEVADAEKAVENTQCASSFVAIAMYPANPAEAERLLRTTTDSKDLAFGMAELAKGAAGHGKIEDALRLDNIALQIDGSDSYQAVLEIARAWTLRDGPDKVLPWARSRPNSTQRVSALVGMAQALGHRRPLSRYISIPTYKEDTSPAAL